MTHLSRRAMLSFMAIALGPATARGQLSLTDRVRIYIPEPTDSTFGQLLTFGIRERLRQTTRFFVVGKGPEADMMLAITTVSRQSTCGALTATSYEAFRLPDLFFLGSGLLLNTDQEREKAADIIVAATDGFADALK